jgi:glycosyltransferase involved in cell wall biosynthesis
MAMRRLIEATLASRPFDAAYIHLFRMAPYLAHRTDLYRIVDLTDVVSEEVRGSLPYQGPIWRSIYSLERPRIERCERWVANTFEETWLISEADRRALATACPSANIHVVTNGVDTSRIHPTGQRPEPNSLVFVGHLRVFHNVDAVMHLVRDVLPLVRQQIPDCTLRIVGADPCASVRRLGNHQAVSVSGFEPDLNDVLNRAAVFVAPLRFAAGVQNKVLEAMASARPVVTSGPVNAGLGARPDRQLLVADGAEATAGKIVKLLRDERLRTKIGEEARRFVESAFSWDHVARRAGEIQRELAIAGR